MEIKYGLKTTFEDGHEIIKYMTKEQQENDFNKMAKKIRSDKNCCWVSIFPKKLQWFHDAYGWRRLTKIKKIVFKKDSIRGYL